VILLLPPKIKAIGEIELPSSSDQMPHYGLVLSIGLADTYFCSGDIVNFNPAYCEPFVNTSIDVDSDGPKMMIADIDAINAIYSDQDVETLKLFPFLDLSSVEAYDFPQIVGQEV